MRRDINGAWKTVYEFLGKSSEKSLPDDDFLKDHWIMYFKYDRGESKAYRQFLLNEHFTAKKVLEEKTLTLKHIRDYVLDIQKVVQSYYYLHYPKDSGCPYSENIKKWLVKLNRLGFGAFKPLITSALTDGWGRQEQEKIVPILQYAEQFIFVAFHMRFHYTNYKDGIIYRQAHQMHEDPSTQNWNNICHELSSTVQDIKEGLSKEDFKYRIREKYREEKFSAWKRLKYFLYEYELFLQEQKRDGATQVFWEDIKDETIEHIYPKNPDNGWDAFNADEGEECLHDLGNLLLLSKRQNSSLQNKPFKEKKDNENGYGSGSYSAMEVERNYPDWTPETIAQRTGHLLDFLMARWELTEKK